MRRWLRAAATVVLFSAVLTSCGNETTPAAPTPTPAAACGADDLDEGVISSFKVDVISNEQARATYVLTRDVEVGVTGFRQILGRPRPALRLVGRVPFGPQRSTVVNERTFDLPKENGQPLPPGDYQLTLRAFESGKLNKGDPIDTKSACITLE